MSQQNVELVEALVAGSGSMDKQEVLAALPELIAETCAPDIEWIEDPRRADSTVHRGHDGVRRSWERWLEQWEEWEGEVERLIDCGETVLVVAAERARGARSGARVNARIYMAFTIQDAKIVRYQEFYDEHAALKAVGLED
jgi:ketosteroid isomerase-like protein